MANLTNSAKLIAEMNKKANRSEIPAVYDSTVTFKINNGTGKTMSTNQQAPSTVNLEIDKSTVGLGNVDNTSDANKPVSTAQQAALDLKADKSTTYTKTEVDSAISSAVSSAYTYKGSVADYDSLPASGNTAGDVRNVEDTGMNYAWTGEAWDALGTTVDLSAYQEKLTTGYGISIENTNHIADLQGPCPEGYHVPTYQELQKLVSAIQEMQPEAASAYPDDGINTSSDMLERILWTEYKGYVIPNSGNPISAGQGEKYILWSSEAYDANNAYSLIVEKGQPLSITGTLKSIGASLICFSDEEITELPSGRWIQTENFTNTALYVTDDSELYTLYINYDNKTKWIKIGLTNYLLINNLYQWGNNAGMLREDGPTGVSTTQVDASGYGPGNYYSSDTFIAVDTDWSSVRNDNLWGGISYKNELGQTIKNTGVLSINGQTGNANIDIPEYVGGEGISIYNGTDYHEMRGPCEEGFHIPSSNEWDRIISTVGSSYLTKYLLMPPGDYFSSSCGFAERAGETKYYYVNVAINRSYITSSGQQGLDFSLHFIREFSDYYIEPEGDNWELLGGGFYHNKKLGLISGNGFTCKDKNIGATEIYVNPDTYTTELTGGNLFQFGNNYPFPYDKQNITTTTELVDVSYYNPSEYSSSTFVINYDGMWWTTDSQEQGYNLWGGVTGGKTYNNMIYNKGVLSVNGQEGHIIIDNEYYPGEGISFKTNYDYSAMRGPCPEGFHIPLRSEWQTVLDILNDLSLTSDQKYSALSIIKIQGWINYTGEKQGQNTTLTMLTCETTSNAYLVYAIKDWAIVQVHSGDGFNIRAFKDSPVIPDETWTTVHGTTSLGIFKNTSLGLISLTADGENWITMQDTCVDSYGFFQFGNNYPFHTEFFVNVPKRSSTQVDTTGYGPGNYYYSDTFITKITWSSYPNYNIWGGRTGIISTDNTITNTGVLSVNGQTGHINIEASEASSITTTQPSNPVEGDIYYDTTNDVIKVYDGTQWNEVGSGGGGDMSNYLAKNNTTAFTPTGDYNPATKKYVDDSVSAVSIPTKVSDLTNDSNFQTATQVNQAISTAVASTYKYKGSVANYASLPASGNTAGDVWNVTDTGMNYAWTGSAWDALGATVDMSNYIAKNNTTAFTPTGDYNPATKKYVDDNVKTYTAGTNVQISSSNVISATDTIYNAGEGIGIGTVQDYSAMRGPCPEGFHVPQSSEWAGLKSIMDGLSLITGDSWRINLHMPFAGSRFYSNGNVMEQLTNAEYWSVNVSNNANISTIEMTSSTVSMAANYNRKADGYSIRAFKDTFVSPDSNWIIIQGNINGAGIFWDQSQGLISITDGTTGYTIMDKNLGSTTVYNDGDTLSEANCGKYYQWGNNYGFPWTGSITTSSTRVDASSYGPGNYYSSDTFITGSTNWSSIHNNNLRGGVTGVVIIEDAISNTGVISVNGQTGNITIVTSEIVYVTQAEYDALPSTKLTDGKHYFIYE